MGSTINIPLPPGSGTGCYAYAMQRVVLPALERFKPDLIFVSSGFDASYADPLASMMMSSDGFRDIATQLKDAAIRLCQGKIIFAHEGGYSKDYVPFCALAVIEALVGKRSIVQDECIDEVNRWGYQALQAHQASVINLVAEMHDLYVDKTNIEIQKIEQNVEDLRTRDHIQTLLDGIKDPQRRQAVLQSLTAI